MLSQVCVHESVPGSPWRYAVDGWIIGMKKEKTKYAQKLAIQYSGRSQERKSWQELTFTELQSCSCVCDVFKVHQSHQINEQWRNMNWVRISQQPWPQDRDGLNCAHVPSAYFLRMPQCVHASMQSMCRGVWMKHRAGRRKTDLIGWFWCVMCSLGYSRICNETKRTRVRITDEMWTCAMVSHVAPVETWVLVWIVFGNELFAANKPIISSPRWRTRTPVSQWFVSKTWVLIEGSHSYVSRA